MTPEEEKTLRQSAETKVLKVKARSRISVHQEHCSLLLSANESFANAEKDLEVLTGMKVSHSTHHRRARGNSLAWGEVESTIKRIGSRIKISGAQWLPESVNPMLRLRCAYLNGLLNAA
jgi:hypothetical protein